jgi:hypothetical protein
MVFFFFPHLSQTYWNFPNFFVDEDLDDKQSVAKEDSVVHVLDSDLIEIVVESSNCLEDDLQFLRKVLVAILGRNVNDFVMVVHLKSETEHSLSKRGDESVGVDL